MDEVKLIKELKKKLKITRKECEKYVSMLDKGAISASPSFNYAALDEGDVFVGEMLVQRALCCVEELGGSTVLMRALNPNQRRYWSAGCSYALEEDLTDDSVIEEIIEEIKPKYIVTLIKPNKKKIRILV